jgi:hypothetical protein
MSTEAEYFQMLRDFPRGVLVRKTVDYPLEWTVREVNKSVEGFVSGYGRTCFRPLKVVRVGMNSITDSEPSWWTVAKS